MTPVGPLCVNSVWHCGQKKLLFDLLVMGKDNFVESFIKICLSIFELSFNTHTHTLTNNCENVTSFAEVISAEIFLPSHCYGFGGAVTGDDGDEAWIVCVLEDNNKHTKCVW